MPLPGQTSGRNRLQPFNDTWTRTLVTGQSTYIDIPVNFVRIISVTGTITVSTDGGKAIPVSDGDYFGTPFPTVYKRVVFTAVAAGTVQVVFGIGSFTAAGSSGGSGGTGSGGVQATTGSPEGVLDASDGQWAFDDSTGNLYVNTNTSGTTGWAQVL